MENAESTASVLARLGYLSPPHETSNSTAPHPDATFLVSPSKGQNPSPAVAEPAKPSPAPLAVVPAAAEVPEASKRGDKLTRGGIADPTAVANPVVQVKSHLRASPGTAGEKAKQPLTLEKLVEEFATDQRQTTARALRLGRHCDAWIRLQPERPEDVKLDRPSAIKFIRRRLAEAKIDRHTARVDRYIRCYWVAQLLGGKAEELSFCSIREMQPLIGRDRATEQWRILTAYAGAATALWARMLAEKLSVNEVRAEVRKILPARSLPIRKRKIKFAALLKAVSVISREERAALIRRCQEVDARSAQPAVA